MRGFLQRVREDHHLGNGRVEAQALDVIAHFLDRLMEQFNELGRVGDGVRDLSVDLALAADALAPDFLEKAVHAFDPVGIPRLHGVERPEEHQVETQGIRAVRLDDRVGAHDIAAALGHFFAVFAENDSLVEQLGEWLALRHDAEVE